MAPVATVSRVYGSINEKKPKEYWDYENYDIKWGYAEFVRRPFACAYEVSLCSSPDKYEVIKRIGRGKYSEVFEGFDVQAKEKCVIKVLKPIKKRKIKREVSILKNLHGGENIIQLLDVVRDPEVCSMIDPMW